MRYRAILLGLIISICVSSNCSANVLDEAIEFNGHYYKAFDMKVSWEDAKGFCESVGGHLATEESDEENSLLKEISNNGACHDYWIGGYSNPQEKGVWKWLNGAVITKNHWEKGYPSTYRKNKFGLIINNKGEWRNTETTDGFGFICEWDSQENAHESTWEP